MASGEQIAEIVVVTGVCSSILSFVKVGSAMVDAEQSAHTPKLLLWLHQLPKALYGHSLIKLFNDLLVQAKELQRVRIIHDAS